MKEYAVQKQLIPVDTNAGDPNWAKRQIWVYKLNGDDTIDEYDTQSEAKLKEMNWILTTRQVEYIEW